VTARKPRHLKSISGTDQPSRRIDGEPLLIETPLDKIPDPPAWLPNAFAVQEWVRITPILQVNKLLTESSVQALGVLCACYGKIVQTYAAGASPTASDLAQYRGLANEFGITPMASSRLKTNPEEPKGNRFRKFGQRPSA
jgi:phage terminase small subunit